MIFKVFIIALILLAMAMLGLGLKLLFNRSSKQAAENCVNEKASGIKFSCDCNGGYCDSYSKTN